MAHQEELCLGVLDGARDVADEIMNIAEYLMRISRPAPVRFAGSTSAPASLIEAMDRDIVRWGGEGGKQVVVGIDMIAEAMDEDQVNRRLAIRRPCLCIKTGAVSRPKGAFRLLDHIACVLRPGGGRANS